jgi:adenine phosphoribosyltransferase
MNPAAVDATLVAALSEHVKVVPDFPRPGIYFQDLSPIFARPLLLAGIGKAIDEAFAGSFDRVLAIEARGFVLGAVVACHGGYPLVLARKQGKLPGPTHSVAYDLEYGRATLEIQHDAVRPEERVIVVDDVLATGGTMAAGSKLVEQAGAVVAGCAVVLRIAPLAGERRLSPLPVFSIMSVGTELPPGTVDSCLEMTFPRQGPAVAARHPETII